ncbi:MAG: transporter substrate-binding domain-containing protein [Oscillospiraceae bacterium]|nr:transporter substrate-binding domain-containing protein [Oscillospiraceae bacterium]MCI9309037.1 transporter substrate-binding domain-containing protein [Oscillospiraceae bacterium]MCI9549797.1 transporter substrate-binding domain-containing protein [Oscillospiraceae bacterium]
MKLMKKFGAFLLALTMVSALAACSDQGAKDSAEPSKAPETQSAAPAESAEPSQGGAAISVYTNAYFAPFEYYDGTDITGVDVDIMNKVGEKLGREVTYTNVEFATIIDTVSSGKLADVGAAGITITPSRQERVDFSDPYFTSVQYVIYPTGEMAPDGTDGDVDYILWDSLAGKKIGVQTDTTGDIYVNGEITGEDFDGLLKDTGASETRYDNAQLAVDAMGAGQVDVVVVDYLPASYIVEKNSGYACAALYYPGGEGEQPSPTEEQYAICVTKGQDELLSAINEVLAELGEDGINALVMEHMGLE